MGILKTNNEKETDLISRMISKGFSMREVRQFLFMKNRKGNAFSAFIVVGLSLMMFIFAAPVLSTFINLGAAQTGTATAFVMKTFLWVIIIIILIVLLKLLSGGSE
jgi:hypothetical protein